VQFTSDLLPADILGVSIYEPATGAFRFHPGPIFAQVVLADEINRASPKTQSALLEAMEERRSSEASPGPCPSRSSSSPRRTRANRSARSPCRSRSSTAF